MKSKTFLSSLQVKAAAKGEVEAVFATTGRWDLDNDLTERGAFGSQSSVPLEGWNHDFAGPPVGVGRIFERGKEAVFEGRFFLSTERGREHFEVVRELAAAGRSEWSYSFSILDYQPAEHAGRPGRILKRLDVFGVSPVTRGAAGPGFTRTVAAKHAGSEAQRLRARLEALEADVASHWTPARVRAELARLSPGKSSDVLKARLAIAELELDDLPPAPGKRRKSFVERWREQLAAEGHSEPWINAVIDAEIAALERLVLRQNPSLEYQPGAARALALQLLEQSREGGG